MIADSETRAELGSLWIPAPEPSLRLVGAKLIFAWSSGCRRRRFRKARRGAEYPDQKTDRCAPGRGRGDRCAGHGGPWWRAAEAHSFNLEPRFARHRLHHWRWNFRAHGSRRRNQRGSRHRALLRVWWHCLRVRRSLLRRDSDHRPDRGATPTLMRRWANSSPGSLAGT